MPTYSLTPDLFKALQKLVEAAATHRGMSVPKFLTYSCGLPKTTRKRWNRISARDEACDIESDNLERIAAQLECNAESLLYKLKKMAGYIPVVSPPRESKLELKAMVRPDDAALSEWLLNVARRPPSLAEVIQRVECKSVDDKDKDVGNIGNDPYTHIVQIGIAVTVHRATGVSVVYTHRRELADPGNTIRTLGGSVLFSKAIVKNHKNADNAIDHWLEVLGRDRHAAVQAMLEMRGQISPVPLYLLRSRIRIPPLGDLQPLRPEWVITNDQRGVVRHDGRVMRTVYTCYGFHVAIHVPSGVTCGTEALAAPDDKRVIKESPLIVQDDEVRRIVSSAKDGAVTVNGMDYVAFKSLQGKPCKGVFDGGNGKVFMHRGFDVA